MKRVLQVGLSDNKGGIESFVLNSYRHIDRSKIQFDFIDNYGRIAYSEEISSLGGEILSVPDFHNRPLAYYESLVKAMRGYEVVHIHMLSLANILPILAAKKAKVETIIVHAHSTQALGLTRKILDQINKRIISQMRLLRLACSIDAGNWMFPRSSFETIRNAIKLDEYRFNEIAREEGRANLGIDADSFVCGNVAALMEEKNHLFLLEVFSCIAKLKPGSYLIVVGAGPLLQRLNDHASELGISDRVLFLGSRNDVSSLYNVFDCFLLPSVFEGAPFTLIEAQTNGLKCYVSKDRVGRENDLIGTMSFISLDEAPEKWADAIIGAPNQRLQEAFERVASLGFDISRQIEKLEAIYLSN